MASSWSSKCVDMVTFGRPFGKRFCEKTWKRTFQKNMFLERTSTSSSGTYAYLWDRPRCQATPARWSLLGRKSKGREAKLTTFRTRLWAKVRYIWQSRPKLHISPSFKGGFIFEEGPPSGKSLGVDWLGPRCAFDFKKNECIWNFIQGHFSHFLERLQAKAIF